MPSPGVRLAGEAAFLTLVALGLWLAEFDPIVIGVVMFVALVLVALLERASRKESARETDAERAAAEPLAHAERVEVEPTPADVAVDEPESKREPEPEPTVSERSARAILASGPPPLPPEPPKPSKPKRRLVERRNEPEAASQPPPQPEPEPAAQGPAREWNLWELQRAVRDAPDDERHEEWTALLIHLREFANADGDLPIEFDALVRESFADVVVPEREPAAAT